MIHLKDKLRAAGKHCGIVTTTPEDLVQRVVGFSQPDGRGHPSDGLFAAGAGDLKKFPARLLRCVVHIVDEDVFKAESLALARLPVRARIQQGPPRLN